MKITVSDFRRRTPEILQLLDHQEQVILSYRGRDRAVLVPIGDDPIAERPPGVLEHPAFGMWADRPDLDDVPAYVREMRTGRQSPH
jgi:antitoxin (DNA-binding transcriptional repressor) of toxin-antitoxin stability system